MSAIGTGNIAKSLKPGVDKFTDLGYRDVPSVFGQVFDMRSSDQYFEEHVGASGFGLPKVKAEGSAIEYDSHQQGFIKRYTHVVYANGYILTREEIEDNKYPELVKYRSRALGKGMREGKEIVHANVLNRAFNSSYTGRDGKELCATDHVRMKDGVSYQNELTTSVDISEVSLEQMMIDLYNMKDETGHRTAINGKTLIVPPKLMFEATRILKSSGQVDTANNTLNALKSHGLLQGDPIVWRYLTDEDAFFILTDAEDGLISFQRRAMSVDQDSADFDTDNVKYKASERYSLGWTNPRGIYGSPGA